MEFGLNEAQTILKKEARKFLQNECPLDYVKEMTEDEKGYSPILWKRMAELGWMGVMFKENYGGSEWTFLDLSIILEEMGRFLLPGPFFSTVILSGGIIMNSDQDEMRQRFLPGIASGDIIMTMALVERGGSYAPEEIESNGELKLDSFVIQGQKMFVSHANIADYIIFPVRTYEKGHCNGISLFIVDAKSKGINIIPLISLNLQRLSEVSFIDVSVPKNNLLGEEGKGWTLVQNLWPIAVTGKCCEMLGAMQGLFEITVDYAQKRRQFDRPLSAFQVIQHQCADMAIEMECSRLITHQAVWRVSQGLPSKKEVAMAKAWSSDALKKIATMAHQIHGGIGFTKDQNLFLYFRYAKAEETAFGSANFHKEIVAGEMDL